MQIQSGYKEKKKVQFDYLSGPEPNHAADEK
jgi:hypothetical protein